MSDVSTEIINLTHFIVFTILYRCLLKVFFFYYAIYCTVQHHRVLLYKYGAIEINKHLHVNITAFGRK